MTKTLAVATHEPTALAKLLSDPDRLRDFPIETVERLFVLDKEIRAEAARREFFEAFNAVQLGMRPVRKAAVNSQTASRYALLEDVCGMLDPIILGHGFSRSLSSTDSPTPNHLRFVLVLRHVGGHEERHHLDAPIDNIGPKGAPTKTALHGMASSMTYCERHLLCKVFGVQVVSDDDGNAAAGVGPGSEKISESQADDLHAMITDVGADYERFRTHFKIPSVGDLPVSRLKEAIALLEAKRGGAMRRGIVVRCAYCGGMKKPIGRSAPLESSYCNDTCPGYHNAPLPGSLWPGETEEDFGYPIGPHGVEE